MRFRSFIMLLLALICAAASSLGVYQYTSAAPTSVLMQTEKENVVILRVDVSRAGTVLTEDMLEVVQRPEGSVNPSAIRKLEDAVGQSVVIPMFGGEPILPAKLGRGTGLAALVPEGMLAFTIQTKSESSLMAGFAMPNDRVDILLTRDDPSKRRGGKVTQRLVQNVRILAAGDVINRPAGNRVEKIRNVTLAVPPGTDQKLAMAQEIGLLTLVLRSAPDDKSHPNNPVYLADLEGAEELALVDRWNIVFSSLASSTRTAASAITNVAQVALDEELKRLTEELNERTKEVERLKASQALAAGNRQSPSAVLTIRGNSQSYVTVERSGKKVAK